MINRLVCTATFDNRATKLIEIKALQLISLPNG